MHSCRTSHDIKKNIGTHLNLVEKITDVQTTKICTYMESIHRKIKTTAKIFISKSDEQCVGGMVNVK